MVVCDTVFGLKKSKRLISPFSHNLLICNKMILHVMSLGF